MDEITPISIIKYRGITVPVFLDDAGQQYYCKIDDKDYSFGSFNTNWKEDLYWLIDNKLDFICDFSDYPGAELKWFFNGMYNRDIQLNYRTRALKIYLVEDEDKITLKKLEEIKKDCLRILKVVKSFEAKSV